MGCVDAQDVGEVDGVLDDVDLVLQVGADVDGGVGDEQRARIGRHVHDEHVADAPRRCAGRWPTATTARHQLVGVQAALHERLDLARAGQRDRRLGGRVAVLGGDDPVGRRGRPSRRRRPRGSSPRARPAPARSARAWPPRARPSSESRSHGWTTAQVTGSQPLAALEQSGEGVVVPQDHDLRGGDLVVGDAVRRRCHRHACRRSGRRRTARPAVEHDELPVPALLSRR